MGNLIVKDADYDKIIEIYGEIETVAEELVDSYFTIMSELCENAVSDGQVYQNIQSFCSSTQLIRGVIGDIVRQGKTKAENYKSEIDEKDEYLY